MIEVKNSRTVNACPPHPAIQYAMGVMAGIIYRHTGRNMRVTGLQEEGHSQNSRHYGKQLTPVEFDPRPRAFDFDADEEHIPADKIAAIDTEARARLGVPYEFQIVWEAMGTTSAHGHVEFDPMEFTR